MKGRDKCELLNEIRQKIADENNIEFTIYECTFEGDCTGTCPKCESELKYLEAELAKKQSRGEKIKLEGIFTLEPEEDEPTCDLPMDDEPLIGNFISHPVERDIDYLNKEIEELEEMKKIKENEIMALKKYEDQLMGDIALDDEKNEKD